MKPQVTIETWTPAAAKKELAEQEKRIASGDYRNRTVNPLTAARYANDMKQGHWLVNNQGIGFDRSGNLLDGRHRLWAIVESNTAVDLLTFRGLESIKNGDGLVINAIDTIDCGRVRSIGNQLMIDGVKNACATASVIRGIGLAAIYPSVRKFGAVPARSIMNLYKDEFEKYSHLFGAKPRSRVRSAFLAPCIMYAKIKPRKAAQFIEAFTTLVSQDEGSPALALDAYARAHAGHHGTNELKDALAATSLAIYHFDSDTKVSVIRHSTIGIDWLKGQDSDSIKKLVKIIGFGE